MNIKNTILAATFAVCTMGVFAIEKGDVLHSIEDKGADIKVISDNGGRFNIETQQEVLESTPLTGTNKQKHHHLKKFTLVGGAKHYTLKYVEGNYLKEENDGENRYFLKARSPSSHHSPAALHSGSILTIESAGITDKFKYDTRRSTGGTCSIFFLSKNPLSDPNFLKPEYYGIVKNATVSDENGIEIKVKELEVLHRSQGERIYLVIRIHNCKE